MKAPPSHVFIDDDGDHFDGRHSYWDPSKKEQNVSDLLRWISDVTIKRRKFRKTSRCSNLLAEAVLSNSLRKARRDLALKQEEKRKKAHEFSYQLTIKCSQIQQESHNFQAENYDNQNSFKYYSNSEPVSVSNNKFNPHNNESGTPDADVQACISSLDNFFSELKSIKV